MDPHPCLVLLTRLQASRSHPRHFLVVALLAACSSREALCPHPARGVLRLAVPHPQASSPYLNIAEETD